MPHHDYVFKCLRDDMYYNGLSRVGNHFKNPGVYRQFVNRVKEYIILYKHTLSKTLTLAYNSFKYKHSTYPWRYCLTYSVILTWLLDLKVPAVINYIVSRPPSSSVRLGYSLMMLKVWGGKC